MKTALIAIFLLVIAVVATLGLRGRTSDRPPFQPWQDMNQQPKYRPQSENRFFADGRSDRTPPAGTIAWGRTSTAGPDWTMAIDDKTYYAAKDYPEQVKLDRSFIERGRALYAANCLACHGGTGDGNGMTTQYGMTNPPSYHQQRLRDVPHGYLYQVITEGKGQMGPIGQNIKPLDRWAVIAYLRVLQRSTAGTLADVPESRRRELDPR
jgi:mono/diheme cytochrome c family protein